MSKHEHEVYASLLLNAVKSIGCQSYIDLIKKFGSAEAAVQCGPKQWEGDTERIEKDWPLAQKTADSDMATILKGGIKVKLWQSDDYPPLLKEIQCPPPIIYIRGKGDVGERKAISVVGSRRASYYGEKVAKELAQGLGELGIDTVSGLARGIDSYAHQATLKTKAHTWAVLGSGLNNVYPPENKKLAQEIQEKGALISEFPLDTQPHPGHFPRRNRIISGLSFGTVVVEGTVKSGSLITARLAADQGREVFAVPGLIHSKLSGASHLLIQQGAKLIQGVEDILGELPIFYESLEKGSNSGHNEKKPLVDKLAKEVLCYVASSPVLKDQLAQKLNMSTSELSALILDLELKGMVRSLPGGFVTTTMRV